MPTCYHLFQEVVMNLHQKKKKKREFAEKAAYKRSDSCRYIADRVSVIFFLPNPTLYI